MMRLLRLITAGAAIGAAVVVVKRLMEQAGAPGEARSSQSSASRASSGSGGSSGTASGSRSTTSTSSSSNGSEPTKAELYERAQELGIEGRSKMTKRELQRAIDAAS